MRIHFRIVLLIGAFLTVFGIGLIVCKLLGAGITVIVKNASKDEITNIQIKFTGGYKSSPKLKPAEFFESKVNPKGASNLVVGFADFSGKQHSADVDVYFEHNYSGTIHISIEPDGNVTWKDETKSDPRGVSRKWR